MRTAHSPQRVRLVSDLHLFSRRSRAEDHLPAIRQAAAEADLFVFAGDTFDYKWAPQTSPESFAAHAHDWLRTLVSSTPGCEIRFLLGNHDHHPALMVRLNDLENQSPNFKWDPWLLRLGTGVFLHGDVANGYVTKEQLSRYRARCERHRLRPGPLRNRFYDVLLAAGIDKWFTRMMFPHRRVATRIIRHLEHVGHCAESGTRDVFFGHTHRLLEGFEHRGLRFHNPGAPIWRTPFRILEAEL